MWEEVLLFFVPFRSQFFYALIVLRWATVAFWASCLSPRTMMPIIFQGQNQWTRSHVVILCNMMHVHAALFELRPWKLTYTHYDKRKTSIIFKVGVKGQGHKLSKTLNLVSTVHAEPFLLGLSNWVHLLIKRKTSTVFQGRVKITKHFVELCKHDTGSKVWAKTFKLCTHSLYNERRTSITVCVLILAGFIF